MEFDVEKLLADLDVELPKTLNAYTENSLQGNGYFDRIMSSAELHIRDEFDKNRITGANYAQVYIQTIQAAMQCSCQLMQDAYKLPLAKVEILKAMVELEMAKANLEKLKLETEHLKWQIEKDKIELEIAKVDLEIKKAQLELLPYQKEVLRWQAVSEQANTCDIINNGEDVYDGATSNIHGLFGQKIAGEQNQVELSKKAAYLSVAEKMVMNPYSVIESAEGVGASYFGLNGSNGIEILNAVREAYGLTKLDTKTYAGEHAKYMNKYAPDANLETSTD